MGLALWKEYAGHHRLMLVLLALVTTFGGVALVIDRPKGTILEWLAVPLLIAGGAIFAWVVWPAAIPSTVGQTSRASRLVRILTRDGTFVKFFPTLGVTIVVADIAYNLILSATPGLQTEDTIVLLGAITLMVYGFVPSRFWRERDFVFLFFVCLNAVLVGPLLIARTYFADFDRSVDLYSWVAVAPETSYVLTALGVSNTVHAVVGSTAPGLTFTPQNLPAQVTVVITTACSGIYSFGIFASAFSAFVLTEYERMSRRAWLLLSLGFLTAYAANVLRMVVVVLVGYYTDTPQTELQNMLVAHSYAGWLIFVAWIALFWGVVFRLFPDFTQTHGVRVARTRSSHTETRCGICGDALSPALTATRCLCRAYYHRDCLVARSRCPACGNPATSDQPAPLGN